MTTTSDSPIIELKDVSFKYKNGEQTLDTVSMEIAPGEIIALAGSSGTGKTTLCYILKGIIPHSVKGNLTGNIIVDGMSVRKTKISKLARSIGMVFQDLNAQLFSNTVLEEVQFGLKNLNMDPNLAMDALNQLGIAHLAQKIPMNLSAGQKQRVILASIIALQPKILLLDEPSVHLDYKSKLLLRDWLIELNRKRQMTIIIASNDPWLIGETCADILYLDEGRLKRVSKETLMTPAPLWMWNS